MERMEGEMQKIRADEAKLQEDRAKVRADEAKVRADEAKLQEDRAKLRADEAKLRADEAKIRANEAKLQEDMAKWQAEIEEVREIAESYYGAASQDVQAKAREFFESMDRDRNERVDLEEFVSFMRSKGHTHMINNSFFKMLDTSVHGALEFMDVITLYYIIKSGRPFCAFCQEFIPATFFSCVTCFNSPNNSFIICRRCHKSKNHEHKHDGHRALFLDNYTLLQATKLHPPTTTNQPIPATQTEPTREHSSGRSASGHHQRSLLSGQVAPASTSTWTSTDKTSYMMNELDRVLAQSHRSSPRLDLSLTTVTAAKSVTTSSPPNTHSETPRVTHQNAIVKVTKPAPWKDRASPLFEALDKMIVVGNFVNVVAALSGCTIM